MAGYKLQLSTTAEKTLAWLSDRNEKLFQRIDAAMVYICREPLSGKPLKGEFKGARSYRVGSYRILYSLDHGRLIVFVIDIGDRKEAYR